MSWEITLLYFSSWNFVWFGQKEPTKVQNFRLSATHVKLQQIRTLIGSFCWKYIKFHFKNYRGTMSHDTEEWCKIWRKTDFLFQKWQEFGEFWPEHSKFSKISTLIGSFCAKYITFVLKMYRVVIFHDTEELWKIWRKTYLWFGKWQEEYGKFSPEHLKVSKLGLGWYQFIQIRKCMSLKFTEELCVMAMKNDAKFEEELTCRFKIDMRNLTNFDLSTQKAKKFAF